MTSSNFDHCNVAQPAQDQQNVLANSTTHQHTSACSPESSTFQVPCDIAQGRKWAWLL